MISEHLKLESKFQNISVLKNKLNFVKLGKIITNIPENVHSFILVGAKECKDKKKTAMHPGDGRSANVTALYNRVHKKKIVP